MQEEFKFGTSNVAIELFGFSLLSSELHSLRMFSVSILSESQDRKSAHIYYK
jgi:hypothetical protein